MKIESKKNLGKFAKGTSGNPAGRPREVATEQPC